jgi:hypothetical protein
MSNFGRCPDLLHPSACLFLLCYPRLQCTRNKVLPFPPNFVLKHGTGRAFRGFSVVLVEIMPLFSYCTCLNLNCRIRRQEQVDFPCKRKLLEMLYCSLHFTDTIGDFAKYSFVHFLLLPHSCWSGDTRALL